MDSTELRVIKIVSRELNDSDKTKDNISVTRDSKMRDPEQWDSLNFVRIFTVVCKEFNLDVDDEDAVHFTSVSDITAFIDTLQS